MLRASASSLGAGRGPETPPVPRADLLENSEKSLGQALWTPSSLGPDDATHPYTGHPHSELE
jgi:hypothetical protein